LRKTVVPSGYRVSMKIPGSPEDEAGKLTTRFGVIMFVVRK